MTTTPALTPAERYSESQLAEFRDRGWWDRGSLAGEVDRLADAAPDRPALTDGYGSLTRGELRAQAARLARSLRGLGIREGDRVQAQLPNWNEFVVVYLALARIGAVMVPTMPVYRDDEVTYALDRSAARISFVPGTFRHFDYVAMMRRIRDSLPALEYVVVVRGDAGEGELSFEDLVAGEDLPGTDELGPYPDADLAHAVIFTSGTESRPKGCQHTFATMAFTAHTLARDVFRLTEDDVMLMPTPITHATGMAAGLMSPLLHGAAIHLIDVWEPTDALRRIAEYRTTVSIAATPFLQMTLAAVKADPSADLSSMRVWASAGAPIPEAMLREWRQRIPTCAALPVYGNSEALIVTAMQFDDPAEKAVSSDGRAPDGVVVEIRDEEGRAVPVGDEGEITFFTPGLMLGYWRDPERTTAAIGDDRFFASGDLGRVDDEGFLRVTGRIKDLIIRGGINISAREVEENSAMHPAIAAVAAVSMPDERMGEKVCAFVVPSGEERITVAELARFLQDERHIAVQKCPERIVFVDELPTTATGKIQKFLLRRLAASTPAS